MIIRVKHIVINFLETLSCRMYKYTKVERCPSGLRRRFRNPYQNSPYFANIADLGTYGCVYVTNIADIVSIGCSLVVVFI